jgi:hypothetical protein
MADFSEGTHGHGTHGPYTHASHHVGAPLADPISLDWVDLGMLPSSVRFASDVLPWSGLVTPPVESSGGGGIDLAPHLGRLASAGAGGWPWPETTTSSTDDDDDDTATTTTGAFYLLAGEYAEESDSGVAPYAIEASGSNSSGTYLSSVYTTSGSDHDDLDDDEDDEGNASSSSGHSHSHHTYTPVHRVPAAPSATGVPAASTAKAPVARRRRPLTKEEWAARQERARVRQLKNRAAAKVCRLRKVDHYRDLAAALRVLRQENDGLRAQVARTAAEIAGLRASADAAAAATATA